MDLGGTECAVLHAEASSELVELRVRLTDQLGGQLVTLLLSNGTLIEETAQGQLEEVFSAALTDSE